MPLDLAQHRSLAAKAREAIDVFGRIDILINNGGMSCRGEVADTTIETHKKVMDVNYFGAVELTRGP